MSSSGFTSSLDLSPRPSLRAVVVLSVLHMAAVGLVALANPQKWVTLTTLLLFVASWFSLRRHPAFGYGPKALSHLILHAEGGWMVENARGERAEAELLGSSVVQSWIIVMNFRLKAGGVRSRVLVGDELGADELRRLRARLLAGA